MRRRSQLIPWKVAGRVSERMASGDDVVRETGWVFNNATGDELTLAEFVATGDDEVPAFLETFELREPKNQERTLVEIGAGIGRMTCAFTREFGAVIACDLDQGFLERCYETVGRFGKVERLRTLEVADGRTLDLAPNSADVAFSYITLQHCDEDDALEARVGSGSCGPPGRQGRAQLPRTVGERLDRDPRRCRRAQPVPRPPDRRLVVATTPRHTARVAGLTAAS